jgi:hypothetical protein
MSWGYKIAAMYGGFVAFIISMVVVCVKQDDIHLVSKDYYKEEIAYQDQIDKLTNAKRLTGGVGVQYTTASQEVLLFLPQAMHQATGSVLFFRPADARKDQKVALQLNESGKQIISTRGLSKGLWKVKVQWTYQNIPYFNEQVLVVQ